MRNLSEGCGGVAVTSTIGTIVFGPVVVAHDAGVLTPRPWTLAQARWAAAILEHAAAGRVLELGSGAGHIGLAAAAWSGRELVQVDACPRACELARRNARAAGVETVIRNAEVSSALDPSERFAMIIADPPYVPSIQVEDFPKDPRHSIDGGPDGLDVARECVRVAERHLQPGGRLLVQLWNAAQAKSMAAEILQSSPLRVEATWQVGNDGALLLAVAPCDGYGRTS